MKDLFIYTSKLKTTREKNLIFVAGSNPSIAEFIDKKLGRRGVILVALLDIEQSKDKVIISVPTIKVGDEIRPICKTQATVGSDGELTLEGSFLLDVSNMNGDEYKELKEGVFAKKIPMFIKMYDFGDSNVYNAVSANVTSHELMHENVNQETIGFISKAKTYTVEGEFELSDIILNEQFMKYMEFPKLEFDDVYMELEGSEEVYEEERGSLPNKAFIRDTVGKYLQRWQAVVSMDQTNNDKKRFVGSFITAKGNVEKELKSLLDEMEGVFLLVEQGEVYGETSEERDKQSTFYVNLKESQYIEEGGSKEENSTEEKEIKRVSNHHIELTIERALKDSGIKSEASIITTYNKDGEEVNEEGVGGLNYLYLKVKDAEKEGVDDSILYYRLTDLSENKKNLIRFKDIDYENYTAEGDRNFKISFIVDHQKYLKEFQK